MSLIATIEQDLTAAGHTVDDVLHGVLARHLHLGSLATHVAQAAAGLEASPAVQALERAALGPAGEQLVASWVDGLAGFLAPAAPQPEPLPAAPQDVPLVMPGPVTGGQAA